VLAVARHRAIDVARRNGPHAKHGAADEVMTSASAGDIQRDATW
jgi:hypothetical protein